MKREYFYYLAAAAICAAAMLYPRSTEARSSQHGLSIRGGGDTCATLEVTSRDGSVSRAEETFTEAKGGTVAVDGASHGMIRVRGWDRQEYAVSACKFFVSGDPKSISVHRAAGRYSVSGPSSGEWLVYFIVHAPRGASLDLESRNQPVSVADVSGTIRARTTNGPLSLAGITGHVQARAVNGPVSYSGGGGSVSLSTQNGPVSVKLTGTSWEGTELEARTLNGPVSVTVPDNYRSGVRIESSGHAPVSCRAVACTSGNTARPAIRLSTEHGPISVKSATRGVKLI